MSPALSQSSLVPSHSRSHTSLLFVSIPPTNIHTFHTFHSPSTNPLYHHSRFAGAELSPPNQDLLVQQGGTIAFDGTDTIFRHDDAGILKYTDMDLLLQTVLQADIVFDTVDVTVSEVRVADPSS